MARIAEGLRAQHGLRVVSDMPCVRLSILKLLAFAACANLDQGLEPLLSLVLGDCAQGFGCVDVHRKSKRYVTASMLFRSLFIVIKCYKVIAYISCLS